MTGVERLNESDADTAGDVLTRAFFDDPLAAYMFPDSTDRRRLLPWHFGKLARYGARYGNAYTTESGIRGVSVWFSPGDPGLVEDRMAAIGMDRTSEMLGEDAFERFMNVASPVAELRAADMPDPHWYLGVLGVDPDHVGRGIASALMRPALVAADAEGHACYLETAQSANRAFYENRGFRVIKHDTQPDTGVTYWTFRREPASRRKTAPAE